MPINWGNVVTDPAEKARIMGLATDFVNRNEAGGGAGGRYLPGFSRDQAIEQAAYSYFPRFSGSGAAGGASVGTSSSGSAPTPTPYGDFTAPAPGGLSAAAQFRLAEGLKARQRSAAARGTLFNTGTLKELERFGSGLASQEYDNDFNRALETYRTNRDTNAQNYGQSHTSYNDSLAGFRANHDVDMDRARLEMAKNADARIGASTFAPTGGLSYSPTLGDADSFAEQVASARAQNDAQMDMLRRPMARTGLNQRVFRGAGA